jgi:hypothetical protein
VLLSLVALGVVVLLVLSARLSVGPINLDFLTPKIDAALNVSPEFKPSVEHTQLVWRDWKHPFEIELVNFRVKKNQDPNWLKIEHVGVSLSLSQLLTGNFVLRHVRLYHPRIVLERDEQGKFSLGMGDSDIEEDLSFESLAPLLALGSKNSPLGQLNGLKKLSIVGGYVVLKDNKTKQMWELPNVTFTLLRYFKGFHAELTLTPLRAKGSLSAHLSYLVDTQEAKILLDFQNIALESLIEKDRLILGKGDPTNTTFDDMIDFFQNWNAPLTGKARLTFLPGTIQIVEGQGNLDFGSGTLDLSVANLHPLPLEAGNVSFTLSPRAIELSNLSLLSGEMLVQFSGKLLAGATPLCFSTFLSGGQTLELKGRVEDLPIDHLGALWPQNLAIPAREWLTQNLRKGRVTEASFALQGHGGENGFSVDKLDGFIKGEDAELTYIEGLPPVEHTNANATFDKKGFDIDITAGEVKGVKIQKGHVIIKDLDTDDEYFILDTKGKGPLAGVLNIIDHKPFEYAQYAEIKPSRTKGESVFDLHIEFPLVKDLTFKKVKLAAKGICKNVSLQRSLTKDKTTFLTGGTFSLDLTQDKMRIQGTGAVDQLPATLLYTHFFTPSSPHELQIQMDTTASFIDLKRLGFDCTPYKGEGSLKTRLTYTLEKNKERHLATDIDMSLASFNFPPLKWQKKVGEKSSLSFKLFFENGHLSEMKDLNFHSLLYSFKGNMVFDYKNDWKKIHFSEFKGPHTHAQITIHTPRENMFDVSIKGKGINAEEFLKYIEEEEEAKDYHPTDIKILANVEKLRLGEGKFFHNVKATAHLFLEGEDSFWKEVRLRAKAGEGRGYKGNIPHLSGGILFDLIPGPHHTKTLTVNANDAGRFLKNLSIYDNVQGGSLIIEAVKKGAGPYEGAFKIYNFDAHKVPLAARFAAVLSPIGIANLFSEEESLSMERFKCRFSFDDDSVVIHEGAGRSISLGFTTKGKLDRKNRLYSLQGNIIPARFINSFLNNIPIVGTLLLGGKGEGLFGIAYTVGGSFDTPDIFVNPLSMLAPGFLRKLFSGDD